MSEWGSWTRLTLVAVFFTVLTLSYDNQDWPGLLWVFGLFQAGLALTRLCEAWWRRYQWRREIRELRSWDPADVQQFLDRQWSKAARAEYRRRLQGHLGHESDGIVERFPFASADRERTTVTFWSLFAVVLGVGAMQPFLPPAPPAWHWTLFALGVVAAVWLVYLYRRLGHLTTVLEVTRFGVAEVHASGLRRSVTFTMPLVLRNRPVLRRLQLHPGNRREYIRIDYDRVACVRAVRLIVEYAGFQPPAGADVKPVPDDQ